MRLRTIMENALQFTSTRSVIIAHVSTPLSDYALSSTTHSADKINNNVDWSWILEKNASSSSSRLYVNPINYPVKGFTGKVLHTHLLNFAYAEKLFGNFSHFVFMSEDCILHKKGVEEWIVEKDLSFSLGFTSTREYNLNHWRKQLKGEISSGNLSRISQEPAQKKDRYYTQKIMGTDLYQRLGKEGLWHVQPPEERFTNHYQLEGTFYPKHVIERFSEFLETSGLRKVLPSVDYFSGEIWVPCYVLKHHQSLVMSSEFVPPIIGRYRDFAIRDCCIIGTQNLYALVHGGKGENATGYTWSGFDSVFGIKFQRPHLEAESAVLYREICGNNSACKKKVPWVEWVDIPQFEQAGCRRDSSLSPAAQLLQMSERRRVPGPTQNKQGGGGGIALC